MAFRIMVFLLPSFRRDDHLIGIVAIVRRRGSRHHHTEVLLPGCDGFHGFPEVFEVSDEADLINDDMARVGAGCGWIGGDDLGSGIARVGVPELDLQFRMFEQVGHGVQIQIVRVGLDPLVCAGLLFPKRHRIAPDNGFLHRQFCAHGERGGSVGDEPSRCFGHAPQCHG